MDSSKPSQIVKDAREKFITETIDKHRASFDAACSWSNSSLLRNFRDKIPNWMERTLDTNGFGSACKDGRTEDMRLLYEMRSDTVGSRHRQYCSKGNIQVLATLLALDSALTFLGEKPLSRDFPMLVSKETSKL